MAVQFWNGLGLAIVLLGLQKPVLAVTPQQNSRFIVQAQTVEELRTQSIQLNNEGHELWQQKQWHAALEKFEQALKTVQEIEEPTVKGAILYNLGGVYYDLGLYKRALAYFKESLSIYKRIGNHQGEAGSLNYIGYIYQSFGQYKKALNRFGAALLINQESGNISGESVSLNNLGAVHKTLGQYSESLELFQKYFEIQKILKNHRGEGVALNNIGSVYSELGQYNKALVYFQKSLAIRNQIGDQKGQSVSLGNLGDIYGKLGKTSKALDYHQQALSISREIGHARLESSALNNIGEVYRMLGQYGEALDYHRQSFFLKKELGDRPGEARYFHNMGLIYENLGQQNEALLHFQKSLSILQEVGDRQGEGESLNAIGAVYDNLAQYKESLIHHKKALAIRQEIGDRSGESVSLNNIGEVYRKLDQYDKALQQHTSALSIQKDIEFRWAEGFSLSNIGLIYDELNQFDKALEYYQQSLIIRQEIRDREGEGITLNNIAHALNAQNQIQLATLFFKQSVSNYEAIRSGIQKLPVEQQKSYTRTIEHTYRALADLLLQQDRILEAQQVLDLLKVQELEDYLQNTRSSDSSDLIILKPEQEILDRYQELQTTAIEIGRELTKLRQLDSQNALTSQQIERLDQLIALETDINQQFNNFLHRPAIQTLITQLAQTTDSQNLSLKDLSGLSDNLTHLNAALIYPLILEDRLELILATPNSPPIRRTVTKADNPTELNRLITQYRAALDSPTDLEGTQQLAQQLYNWILKPLEADLTTLKPDTLIYAPDGVLRYIPLAALHDGDQWVAQRYATNNIVASSVTDFDSRPKANPKVLAGAFGDDDRTVTLGDQSFPFRGIPFTLTEVQSLKSLLPTQTMAEQAFDRKTLLRRLNSFNIVHLATHGQFVPGKAENSFIALGSGEALPLKDIANLRMNNVDLVVLSACETGVGGILDQGEEILGLGYQFQRAGAKAALASLWQVDDGGTQALMTAFYAALQNGMTKAQALQEAQKALISGQYETVGLSRASVRVVSDRTNQPLTDTQLSHPYYWAPFILIGNGL